MKLFFLNDRKNIESNGELIKKEHLKGFIKRQDILTSELLVELNESIDERNLAKFKVFNISNYAPNSDISLVKHVYKYKDKNYEFITIEKDELNDKIFI